MKIIVEEKHLDRAIEAYLKEGWSTTRCVFAQAVLDVIPDDMKDLFGGCASGSLTFAGQEYNAERRNENIDLIVLLFDTGTEYNQITGNREAKEKSMEQIRAILKEPQEIEINLPL